MTFDETLKYVSEYERADYCSGYKCFIPAGTRSTYQYFNMQCSKEQSYQYIPIEDLTLKSDITVHIDFDFSDISFASQYTTNLKI